MSTGWQCGRCGTMYGLLWMKQPPPRTIDEAIRKAMTEKTILSAYQELRRVLFEQCYEERCPTTLRALLWRVFGRRGHRGTGYRPTFREGLKSLRRGDPLYLSDNEYLRSLADPPENA